eukprot:5301864-Prymnesium_polylepis.2
MSELSITSISELRLLTELGLPEVEQKQILGLRLRTLAFSSGLWVSERQLSSRAIVRLALDPPLEVGKMQRHTSARLLRPYPLGSRLSG